MESFFFTYKAISSRYEEQGWGGMMSSAWDMLGQRCPRANQREVSTARLKYGFLLILTGFTPKSRKCSALRNSFINKLENSVPSPKKLPDFTLSRIMYSVLITVN